MHCSAAALHKPKCLQQSLKLCKWEQAASSIDTVQRRKNPCLRRRVRVPFVAHVKTSADRSDHVNVGQELTIFSYRYYGSCSSPTTIIVVVVVVVVVVIIIIIIMIIIIIIVIIDNVQIKVTLSQDVAG